MNGDNVIKSLVSAKTSDDLCQCIHSLINHLNRELFCSNSGHAIGAVNVNKINNLIKERMCKFSTADDQFIIRHTDKLWREGM